MSHQHEWTQRQMTNGDPWWVCACGEAEDCDPSGRGQTCTCEAQNDYATWHNGRCALTEQGRYRTPNERTGMNVVSQSSVRVLHGHVDLGLDEYHEWITLGGRVKADRLGRPNPRIIDTQWALWSCNNGDCMAQALVHDSAIARLIEAAT